MATAQELRKLALLKVKLDRPDEVIAKELGVSIYTVRKWAISPEYEEILKTLRAEWREQSKQRLTGMVDAALDTLQDLMTSAKSEMVRLQAAKTIIEGLALHNDIEPGTNDKAEFVDELKKIVSTQQPPQIMVFSPPAPGGMLPAEWKSPPMIDAEIIEKKEEKEEEKKS